MALTEQQLLARRSRIGASDVAKICGMSKYGGPLKVWAEKVQGIYEPAGDAAVIGSRCEGGILDWAEKDYGLELSQMRGLELTSVSVCDFPLVVTLDAATLMHTQPVNAKTSGLTGGSTEDWGEAETDDIPTEYIIQEQTEMLATGADIAFVPALIARRGFVMFRVQRNESLIESIKENCAKFWRDYVMTKTPPPPDADNPPDEWLLKNLKRQPGSVVDLPQDAALAWEKLAYHKGLKYEHEREALHIGNMITSALGLAEAGRLPDGRLITYYETTRNMTAKEAYVQTFRQLKIKKG